MQKWIKQARHTHPELKEIKAEDILAYMQKFREELHAKKEKLSAQLVLLSCEPSPYADVIEDELSVIDIQLKNLAEIESSFRTFLRTEEGLEDLLRVGALRDAHMKDLILDYLLPPPEE